VFQMSSASQESNRNLASAWQYEAVQKFEDLGNHHKIWTVLPIHSTASICTLSYPPIWSPEGCSPHYEVWDWWQRCDSCSEDFATWAGQGLVLTRHTHTCSSLAQDCGKIVYGIKPSYNA
jgi:hypothetical protein